MMKSISYIMILCLSAGWALGIDPQAYGVHDPSIIKAEDGFYVFSTGDTLDMRRSGDLYDWDYLGGVFDEIPQWVQDKVPAVTNLWAPDITYHNGKYYMNYSGSEWGTTNSVIGLLSNETLNPYSPDYEWIDEGEIISSADKYTNYNTIDGAFVKDENGRMWMAFGSYWSGIKLTSLDNSTLKPDTSPAAIYSLANRAGAGTTAIEAPYIVYRNGYYYLFVNWDTCCQGANSTYKIMVGRSTDITGPYYDKNGVSMTAGGGSLFIGSGERWVGPGHASVVKVNGRDFISYHCYDAYNHPASAQRVNYLGWDTDLWPVLGDSVTSPVTFEQTLAHWDFEDGSAGQELSDTGGSQDIAGGYMMYGYDANSGPQFSSEGDAPGGPGLSLELDGSEDGYTLDPNLNRWSPLEWTIEVSVKLNDTSGWNTIIGRDGSSQGEAESDFYLQNNGVTDPENGVPDAFRVNFDTTGGQRYILDSNFAPAAGRWYNLAVVSDGETVTMYADQPDGEGYQQVGSVDMNDVGYNSLAATNYNWTFGRGWYDGNFVDHINGNIDDVRFTNEPLSSSQFLHYSPLLITESNGVTEVIEHGETSDTFQLRLYHEQTSPAIEDNVTVDISANGQVEVSPSQLVFTPSNWDVNQTVTVTAVDDDVLEDDPHQSNIEFTLTSDDSRYDGVSVADLTVDVYDDECGAWGYVPYDINQDCRVDFEDFAFFAGDVFDGYESMREFAQQWLDTTQPYAENAVKIPD